MARKIVNQLKKEQYFSKSTGKERQKITKKQRAILEERVLSDIEL